MICKILNAGTFIGRAFWQRTIYNLDVTAIQEKPIAPQPFWFNSGVEEVFAVSVLPGYHNPALVGPDTELDGTQSVWPVPSMA